MSEAFQAGDIVSIEYRFGGNGPWNYMIERPPGGITHVRSIGVYVGETDRHFLTAHDFSKFGDGRLEPTHCQHWPKDGPSIISVLVKNPSPPAPGRG